MASSDLAARCSTLHYCFCGVGRCTSCAVLELKTFCKVGLCQVPHMLGAWSLFCILCAEASDSRQLRGLQETVPGVAPRCRPGYQDISNGQAYDWACAFHCPGGAWATAQCACACMSEAQIERLGSARAPQPAARGTDLLLTSTLQTTPPPPQPVVQAPIGGLGDRDQRLEAPRVNSFDAVTRTTTTEPEVEQAASFTNLVLLGSAVALLSGSAAIVAAAVFGGCRKGRKQGLKQRPVASAPMLPMHLPVEKCPEPPNIEVKLTRPALADAAAAAGADSQIHPGQHQLDELELSSVITKTCDEKGLSMSAGQPPVVETSEQPLGAQKKSSQVAKISQVQPV